MGFGTPSVNLATNTGPIAGSNGILTSLADATKVFQIRGTSTQSANLQEWQVGADGNAMGIGVSPDGQNLMFSGAYAGKIKWNGEAALSFDGGRGLTLTSPVEGGAYIPLTIIATYGTGKHFLNCLSPDTGTNVFYVSYGGGICVGGGTEIAKLRHGTATLVAGVVTVTDTAITANSRIFPVPFADGGTPGARLTPSRSAGASFTITSNDAGVTQTADTSIIAYLIIEPA